MSNHSSLVFYVDEKPNNNLSYEDVDIDPIVAFNGVY